MRSTHNSSNLGLRSRVSLRRKQKKAAEKQQSRRAAGGGNEGTPGDPFSDGPSTPQSAPNRSLSPGMDYFVGFFSDSCGVTGKKQSLSTNTRCPQANSEGHVFNVSFSWRVIQLLGSGGFGDVYKVVKHNEADKSESAMKTEMVIGDRRLLRLKIEVMVLMKCHEQADPSTKEHFVPFVDRGKTMKFKFLVMGLVGKSLEDIRRDVLNHNYTRSTVIQCSIQTLTAVRDLHNLGYLHRDIKPQNFATGLGPKQSVVYMLDFGIARKFTVGETKEVKIARAKVSFLGTVRFASRACHKCLEQGRKDDLESWIFMVFELFDDANGLPWKRATRDKVVPLKEKFFKNQLPKCYKVVPADFKRIVEYIDGMKYADEPDYIYITNSLNAIAKENKIDLTRKLDWIGVVAKHKRRRQVSNPRYRQTIDNRVQKQNSLLKRKCEFCLKIVIFEQTAIVITARS
ncbi:hypothetical protein OESDEN_07141 [Oesophagostomum dentatum]|uniref:Protein kinase domain-containing protein n=1 Tax=Oesophagostomum dentatum TaxID=61180 RepID=A0A0B1T5U4_OESDE|nr:hypothetical protein OESDEN_07141 [Oesophagostomum dentatum]